MRRAAVMVIAMMIAIVASAAGDVKRGASAFRACVACHSIEPGMHRTGPSLAGLWGRAAGSLEGFTRYSNALKRSGIVWDERTLDAWLRDPQATIPGNYMIFQGLADARARADLIAFLRETSARSAQAAPPRRPNPDLKRASSEERVAAIRHCGDSYFVTNGSGKTAPFWEFNLRIKTDSSASGPAPGKPVLVGAGMQGDRAQVVFAHPQEISGFIVEKCEP